MERPVSKQPQPTPIEERDYYTAEEAKQILGMAHATFFRAVRDGDIPKYKSQRGKYPKDFIDAMASAQRMVAEHLKYLGVPHFNFSKSTPAQQEEEMRIGIACFGSEFITPLDLRIAFQMKNPYSFWSLKRYDPATSHYRVMGYISMFRFPPEFQDDILTGKHIEIDITLNEVLRFEKGVPFSIYIDVLATDPELPEGLRSWYGWLVVKNFVNEILNLLANGFQIETLYTVTATKEGDNLVRKLGFQLMKGKSQSAGRIAYQFPLDEEGTRHLQQLSRREV